MEQIFSQSVFIVVYSGTHVLTKCVYGFIQWNKCSNKGVYSVSETNVLTKFVYGVTRTNVLTECIYCVIPWQKCSDKVCLRCYTVDQM